MHPAVILAWKERHYTITSVQLTPASMSSLYRFKHYLRMQFVPIFTLLLIQ